MAENESSKPTLWYILFAVLEIIIVLIYAFATEYKEGVSPNYPETNGASEALVQSYYAMYQNIHVMIFVGFGFLMTFLKSGSWSAVSFNFMLGAFTIQFAIPVVQFWMNAFYDGDDREQWIKVPLTLGSLIEGDFAAASVLVAFGAVLGKVGPIQLIVMAVIQIVLYGLNLAICIESIKAFDVGRCLYTHLFGALFGCAVSKIISEREKIEKNPKMSSSYNSNLFAFIGTLFLFMYWPSFNGVTSFGNRKQRVVVNTVVALTGSCLSVFITSPLFNKGKFKMESVLNATLAGGVCIGCVADIISNAWGALIIGVVGGVVSIVFFESVVKVLLAKHWLYDTCGVFNLHGVPGVIGGLLSAFVVWGSDEETYALSVNVSVADISTGSQGGKQLLALLVTIAISLVGGVLTGYVLKALPKNTNYFDDHAHWDLQEIDEEENKPIVTENVISTERAAA